MNSQEITEVMKLHLDGLSAEEIGKELGYTTKTISSFLYKENLKPESELKPEPEQIVLKWKEFKKITKSTHPKNLQHCLVVTRNNNYFTCFFSKISSNSMDFYLLNPKSEEEDEVIDNVVYWMPLPSAPRNEDEINDEYLIEQMALETFDIIDAITPALRDAVKHLLVQQGASK